MISADLRAWIARPKRGYTAELADYGNVLRLWIKAPAGWFGVNVDLPVSDWRRSVARALAYLRNHVRQQARRQVQDRPRPSTRLQVAS